MDKEVKIIHESVRLAFKQRRKEMKLSIRDLAAVAGVEPNLIFEFEKEGRDIRLSSLIALSHGLGLDIMKIFK